MEVYTSEFVQTLESLHRMHVGVEASSVDGCECCPSRYTAALSARAYTNPVPKSRGPRRACFSDARTSLFEQAKSEKA